MSNELIAAAYARYDADPRVHGPDDFDAFCDAFNAGILGEIAQERERQDEQWGGPAHDDLYMGADFLSYILKQVSKYRNADFDAFKDLSGSSLRFSAQKCARARLIKIAALAVAGIQSIDRTAARSAESGAKHEQ